MTRGAGTLRTPGPSVASGVKAAPNAEPSCYVSHHDEEGGAGRPEPGVLLPILFFLRLAGPVTQAQSYSDDPAMLILHTINVCDVTSTCRAPVCADWLPRKWFLHGGHPEAGEPGQVEHGSVPRGDTACSQGPVRSSPQQGHL